MISSKTELSPEETQRTHTESDSRREILRHFVIYADICDMLLMQSLMHHYHHSVATEAKKLEQPLPKFESDLAAQLDTSVDDVGICYIICIIFVNTVNIVENNRSANRQTKIARLESGMHLWAHCRTMCL